ncbi:MAG TPA: hypothetical protein VGH28_24710 [Polyangiaceae bacterium]|jgi:hypothetical protein
MNEPQLDALTAAMAMVPGLYSRNRMFQLFKDPMVRRARSRARMIRGLVRFVGRADAEVEMLHHDGRVRVSYRIARLRLARMVQIGEFELALLRVLLARGPHPAMLDEQASDRARVDAALALLPKEAVSSVA